MNSEVTKFTDDTQLFKKVNAHADYRVTKVNG